MTPDLIHLRDLLDADEAEGTLRIGDRRVLLFDADAMGLLRKQLIDGLDVDAARLVLATFGYARGYREALAAKHLFRPQSFEEWWREGIRLNAIEGAVSARLLRYEIDEARGHFEVEAEWRNSYEAEQHLRHIGPSDVTVCWTLTSYASGYTTAAFGRDVIYVERECVGRGDPRCLVVGRVYSEDMGEEFAPVAARYRKANFGAEAKDLMRQLEERSKDLARQRERVRALEAEMVHLEEAIKGSQSDEALGTSPAFRSVIRDVERVAPSDATVLITGETGTGKDILARVIHARGNRANRPLITVDCAALPSGLVESELFGHEKGSFTGAHQRKIGRFELARGATIFLDEIGELQPDVQVKFLRVLQRGEFERVGGTVTLETDARVIAATNRSLDRLVAEGKFRSDLYFRLNVFPIAVPPLRERREDIALLANYFAQRYRARFRKPITSIEEASIERLRSYSWPGNVRELEHIVERAVLLSEGPVLRIPGLPDTAPSDPDGVRPTASRLATMEEAEREHIRRVLGHTNGRISGKGGAAEVLGLPDSTLRSRMKKLGVR
jgi:two-component system, NtrC family, response regulator HydG